MAMASAPARDAEGHAYGKLLLVVYHALWCRLQALMQQP